MRSSRMRNTCSEYTMSTSCSWLAFIFGSWQLSAILILIFWPRYYYEEFLTKPMAAQQKGGHSHWGAGSSTGQQRHRRVRFYKETWAFLLPAFIVMSCDVTSKNKGVLTPMTLIPTGEISCITSPALFGSPHILCKLTDMTHDVQVFGSDDVKGGLRRRVWHWRDGFPSSVLHHSLTCFFGLQSGSPHALISLEAIFVAFYTVLVLSTQHKMDGGLGQVGFAWFAWYILKMHMVGYTWVSKQLDR